jgi:hypothetical protein
MNLPRQAEPIIRNAIADRMRGTVYAQALPPKYCRRQGQPCTRGIPGPQCCRGLTCCTVPGSHYGVCSEICPLG